MKIFKSLFILLTPLVLMSCITTAPTTSTNNTNTDFVTERVPINGGFDEVIVNGPIDVEITQNLNYPNEVSIEGPRHLTSNVGVNNNGRQLYINSSIAGNAPVKVYLNANQIINSIQALNGASLRFSSTGMNNRLMLYANQSFISAKNINTQEMVVTAENHSTIEIIGQTIYFDAIASVTSVINARNLMVRQGIVRAQGTSTIPCLTISQRINYYAGANSYVNYYGSPGNIYRAPSYDQVYRGINENERIRHNTSTSRRDSKEGINRNNSPSSGNRSSTTNDRRSADPQPGRNDASQNNNGNRSSTTEGRRNSNSGTQTQTPVEQNQSGRRTQNSSSSTRRSQTKTSNNKTTTQQSQKTDNTSSQSGTRSTDNNSSGNRRR